MNRIQNLILIPNTKKHIDRTRIAKIIKKLLSFGIRISVFEKEKAEVESFSEISVIQPNADLSLYDAVLVLGGDGSILQARHRLDKSEIPILGINFGHVGFLSELDEGEIDLLDALDTGEYSVQERMMLEAVVTGENGEEKASFTVLNDIVITNGPIAHLLSFDLSCDGHILERIRADGVIAATPTGSTAYSLSAGGPVLDPTLDSICLTPICPHTLSSRPILFRGDTEITIRLGQVNKSAVYLNADGRDVFELCEGDNIIIKKSNRITKLIRIKDSGFVVVLRNKLSEN